jgi:hypothetical protein
MHSPSYPVMTLRREGSRPGAGRRGGFTLIELMLAVALGMSIVLLAASAFRVTSESVRTAQRMARINEMISIGVLAALDEVDHWDAYDDRSDDSPGKSGQRLRQSLTIPVMNREAHPVLGLPFSPFRGGGGLTATFGAQAPGGGWRDDEQLWAVSADNELTWWPGNKAESQETDCRFGHYSIFGVSRPPTRQEVLIDPQTRIERHGAWMPRNGGLVYGTIPMRDDPIPDPGGGLAALRRYRHQSPGWTYNQMHGLANALGWYGMMDYLPANSIVCWSVERSGRGNRATSNYMDDFGFNFNNSPADVTDSAGRPIFLIKTFSRSNGFANFGDRPYFVLQTFSPNWCPHGIDFLTAYTAYGLVPPKDNQLESGPAGQAMTLAELCYHNRNIVRMESHDIPIGDWGSNNSNDFLEPAYPSATEAAGPEIFSRYVKRTTSQTALLERRPEVWPEVGVSVGRYLRLSRFSAQFKVSWSEPHTGEQAELRFTAMGSTLRGARRMRGLD